jgi:hypothetical protein
LALPEDATGEKSFPYFLLIDAEKSSIFVVISIGHANSKNLTYFVISPIKQFVF